ncbi:MAG: hypothetical protein Q9222_004476 [Ikaeria aurantiellina]
MVTPPGAKEMEPIAIVGVALKFPQDAISPDAFWNMMMEGRCAMTEFPPSRMNIDAFYNPQMSAPNTIPIRGGHFIREDLGAFDASFFSITPAEAAAMDPAQRMLLETAYHAFEAAGIGLDQISGTNTSVHTGCFTDDYKLQLLKDTETIPKYAATGASLAMLANRLSWFFNLSGPSMNIDSACSSSAIAIDASCQLLRSGECSMGLVAGCNLTYVHDYTTLLSKMSFLSPDSRCFAFDERANGYARGEGIGAVVLKRLSDAVRDGNTIRAVIRSSGSNQDAHTPGITQPSSKAQERLIRETYRKAGLSMKHTRFVEAHGTGTKIGDTIEIDALGNAFRNSRDTKGPLHIGAVKTNVGHLEGASGMAGLIKAILVLEKGVIPPNANFERLNPRIDAEFLKVSFPPNAIPWPHHGLRRASINSFGFGGSNCHIVLDDACHYLHDRDLPGIHTTEWLPPNLLDKGLVCLPHSCQALPGICTEQAESMISLKTPKLLLFSSTDEAGVKRIASQYQQHLNKVLHQDINHVAYINDLAYTLDTCRSMLAWKSHVIVERSNDLKNLAARVSSPVCASTGVPRLAFVFTGQGAQWFAMGRELLHYPVFASSVEAAERYNRSLGCIWSAKGIVPAAVVGHSSGEIAAAYCAGAISRESAWRISYFRGQVSATLPGKCSKKGGMLAVGLSAEEVEPFLRTVNGYCSSSKLTIACYNSRRSITVSGNAEQINLLKSNLDGSGIFSRKLRVPIAYHSGQMNCVAGEYLDLLGQLDLDHSKPRLPMASTVTGRIISPEDLAQGEYWVQNMCSAVQFRDAVKTLCQRKKPFLTKKLDKSHLNAVFVSHLVEIGPTAALQGPTMDCVKECRPGAEIPYYSVLHRNKSASKTFLGTVGSLHAIGIPVDIRGVNDPAMRPGEARKALCDLPSYPFDHTSTYWHESRMSAGYRLRNHGHVELLGSPSPDWNPLDAQWRNVLRTDDITWAGDHRISGAFLCPGAGMIAMALEAASQIADPARQIFAFELRNIVFGSALDLAAADGNMETRFSLRAPKYHQGQESAWLSFSVYSLIADDWTEHCSGSIQTQYRSSSQNGEVDDANEMEPYKHTWLARAAACDRPVDDSHMYQYLRERGIDYGPAFQRMHHILCSGRQEVIAELQIFKETAHRTSPLRVIHPATLDAVMHSVFAAQSDGGTKDIGTEVPTAIRNMWISHDGLNGDSEDSIMITTGLQDTTPLLTTSSTLAFDTSLNSLRIAIDGLEMSTVDIPSSSTQLAPNESQVWCRIQDLIDVDLLTPELTSTWLSESHGKGRREPVDLFQDIHKLLSSTILGLNGTAYGTCVHDWEKHMQRYSEWLGWQASKDNLPLTTEDPAQAIVGLRERVRKQGPVGLLYSEVADHLEDFISGKADIRQLLYGSDLVKDFYKEQTKMSLCYGKLQQYLSSSAIKRSNMRILEVGAGTGVFTEIILGALASKKDDNAQSGLFDHYDFTDISPAFFENARILFSTFQSQMDFKILDIENVVVDPVHDGQLYDLIVAANVLHVTKNINNPLRNLRRRLKSGGKLVIHETTTPDDIKIGFVFGLLKEWWLASEPDRRLSPLRTERQWDLLLKENGFSGTDLVFPDFENKICHQSSIMISTAVTEIGSTDCGPEVAIIADKDLPLQQSVARTLQKRLLEERNCTASMLSVQEAAQGLSPNIIRIVLLELDSPMLQTLDSSGLSVLKAFFASSNQIFWITHGGGSGGTNPGYGMINGFARAMRLERNDLKLATLALEVSSQDTTAKANHVLRAMDQSFTNSTDVNYETDYVEISGELHIRRIQPATDLHSDMLESLAGRQVRQQTLEKSTPFSVEISKPGDLESVAIVAEKISEREKLEPHEIEIEVKAVGLGMLEVHQALGILTNRGFGHQCAGIITRTGSEVDASFEIGKRVCLLGSNVCQLFARSSQDLVASIPDSLSYDQASTVPFVLWLGSHLVDKIAPISAETSVFVPHGACILGQVCIQILQGIGADIFTTADSDEARYILQDRYMLPEDHILTEGAMKLQLQDTIYKKGIDAILDISMSKDAFTYLDCLAPFGTYVHLSVPTTASRGKSPLPDLGSNVTVTALDLTSLSEAYLSGSHRSLQDIMGQMKCTFWDRQEIASYRMSDIPAALRKVKENDEQVKTVIRLNKDDRALVTKTVEKAYDFDPNSTYLISGGLGGLGRCIARWMASRGARNLLLLSRSGPRDAPAREMLAEMQSQGVRVETPKCDAADLSSLSETMEQMVKIMPPIRGCVQASGAIKDTWFSEMSFETWNIAVRPKVDASWNLHTVLPSGLDFFILTASISGIFGQITQVNYASGNTYQDALARYRIARGEKAVSLDLGLLLVDGLLKDDPELVKRLNSTGYFIPVSEAEILAIFDHYCNPNLGVLSPEDAQPVVGIQSPAALRAKGIELPTAMQYPLWNQMVALSRESKTLPSQSENQEADVFQVAANAGSPEEASTTVTKAIANRVAKILSLSPDKLELNSPIHSYGVDSLTAVEIRNWISKTFAVQLSTFEIMGNGSLSDIGTSVARKAFTKSE